VPVVPFSSVDLSALRWLRVDGPTTGFDLLSGEQAVEELRWAKPTGSLAVATTSAGAWTLKRIGFLNTHLTLREKGGDRDVARVTAHYRIERSGPEVYHRIEFPDGPRFWFARAGRAVPAWRLTNDAGGIPGHESSGDTAIEIAHVEPARDGRKLTAGAVVVSEPGRSTPELPALLAIVWYAIVLAWFEDEVLIPFEEAGLALPARD
jgi:hypothetical protein